MSKTASLFFAVTAVLLMCATAISISYNYALAALFGVLAIVVIGAGFVWKAKARRK